MELLYVTLMPKKILTPQLEKALKFVGKYYIEGVRSQLRTDGTHASGQLANSLDYDLLPDAIDIVSVKHGKAIDEGIAPASQGYQKVSRLYVQNIMEWAKLKGINPRQGSMEGMAYAIAKSIKKNGHNIKGFGSMGTKVFDRVYNKLEKEIGEDLTSAYLNDLKNKLIKL
jgi:hypothetical protein